MYVDDELMIIGVRTRDRDRHHDRRSPGRSPGRSHDRDRRRSRSRSRERSHRSHRRDDQHSMSPSWDRGGLHRRRSNSPGYNYDNYSGITDLENLRGSKSPGHYDIYGVILFRFIPEQTKANKK
jgi:hypothetical protein